MRQSLQDEVKGVWKCSFLPLLTRVIQVNWARVGFVSPLLIKLGLMGTWKLPKLLSSRYAQGLLSPGAEL